MMKYKKQFIITAILFMVTTVFANPVINTPDKSIVITAKKQHTFNITLPSNPTTGYSWFLTDYNHQLLKPVNHQYVASSNKALMGAGGFEVWTFDVKKEAFNVPQKTTKEI